MGANLLRASRNVEIIFVIDATSSMQPCIDSIKNNAVRFYTQLCDELKRTNTGAIDSLRVKVIAFRDYECDTEAMRESEFFELPNDNPKFSSFLSSIKAIGGGDPQESGLEAIYYAMWSKWLATGTSDRQVIVFFSDNDAIGFDEKKNRSGYPAIFTEKDFYNSWACVTQNVNFKLRDRNKRLVVYAPAGTKYEKVLKGMTRATFMATALNEGLKEINFDAIVKILAASVSAV